MGNNEMKKEDMDDEMYVTLELEDDSEVECVVVTIFEAAGKEYIALLPTEGEQSEEGEVFLYRYSEDADGNPSLDSIESDEEYEIVADAFDEWLDEQEYDELVGEDEV
ncbi:MAG: DUF1292 domain-containing protein [Lachnospiraceae bacterium]|nr:DUF1292 domain-containing protein [Lachnospiraceae bacterium]